VILRLQREALVLGLRDATEILLAELAATLLALTRQALETAMGILNV